MGRYAQLPGHVSESMSRIEPNKDGELAYFPCRVKLKSGLALDTVYIESEQPYLKAWGRYPEDFNGKHWIRIEDVAEVEESPTRLPARFATRLYREVESGMGYTIFTRHVR